MQLLWNLPRIFERIKLWKLTKCDGHDERAVWFSSGNVDQTLDVVALVVRVGMHAQVAPRATVPCKRIDMTLPSQTIYRKSLSSALTVSLVLHDVHRIAREFRRAAKPLERGGRVTFRRVARQIRLALHPREVLLVVPVDVSRLRRFWNIPI